MTTFEERSRVVTWDDPVASWKAASGLRGIEVLRAQNRVLMLSQNCKYIPLVVLACHCKKYTAALEIQDLLLKCAIAHTWVAVTKLDAS